MATKKAAVKAQPKPKFGEVGFRFPVMAEIVSVSTDEDEWEHPVVVRVDMGGWEEECNETGTAIDFKYSFWKNFKEFYAKCDPKFVKTQKQEELKQAQEKVKEMQALVVKLTKELAEIK